MATLSQINSPVWTYSLAGRGTIAEGLAAIRQCIDIIIRTTPGSDPLRPTFGSDVYRYQDLPASVAIPNIKLAILNAVATWEKRVIITQLQHFLDGSHLAIEITYRLVDSQVIDSLIISVSPDTDNTTSNNIGLVLQGFFPPNPSGYQYQIQCVLNGAAVLPAPPATGFSDIQDLYTWVKENWLNYGTWYTNAESLVGYMNPRYRTGELSIILLPQGRFQGGIPPLPIAYKYAPQIDVDGVQYTADINLFTPEQVRQWAETSLGDLGTWALLTRSGAFDDSFSDDFQNFSTVLVLFTGKAQSVIIDITTIPNG